MTTLLYLLITLLLVLLNAFFVAAEFALVKVRPTRLEQLIREGDGRARLALRMSQHLDAYLSATQLGITLASLGLGWIGEPAIAQYIQPRLAALGGWAATAAHGIAFVIAFLVITSLHTIIGELAPKSIAIQRAEAVVLVSARVLHAFYLIAWPIIWFLNTCAGAFIRLFGFEPAGEDALMHTSEELRMLLAQSPAGLDPALRSMLVRIFDLRRRTARHVMSLRSDVVTLRGEMTINEAVRTVGDAGYSRYPVLDQTGNVMGYIHLRDLFDVMRGRNKAARVAELLRKPIFARESSSVERLRVEMQARQIPVAVITSDSGEFVGLVTIEDLLEEIVGEIRDENDEEAPPIHRRGGGILDVDGRVLLADLERETSIVIRPEAKKVETLGGYIIARLEHPAKIGERVPCEGLSLVVTDVIGRRVRRVRIVPAVPPAAPGEGADATAARRNEGAEPGEG